MSKSPAISVAVISYNAAATIEETLDSILQQDYDLANAELLVSDDASTDKTVDIAETWLAKHSHSFNRVALIRNPVNGGVTRNCNVVWKASTGDWIKTIAADDVLLSNCLRTNQYFVERNPHCSVLVSKMHWFGSVDRVTPEPSQISFFKRSALDQYKALRLGRFNFAPSAFIRREALEAVGYGDESFRNIEDLPLWLRLTQRGYRLHFNDCVTVGYRVSESISKSSTRFINVPFLRDIIKLHKRHQPLESDGLIFRYRRFERTIGLYSLLLISKVSGNRRSMFSRFLEVLLLLLRPVDLWSAFRRRIGRLDKSRPQAWRG